MSRENAASKSQYHAEWKHIAASREFKDLLALKRVFIVPALLVSLSSYFALLILIGYAPRIMAIHVFGTLNVAYLLALAQFIVGWTTAWLYLKASARFDELTQDILSKRHDARGGR